MNYYAFAATAARCFNASALIRRFPSKAVFATAEVIEQVIDDAVRSQNEILAHELRKANADTLQ
jgi:hypothetical protein